MKFGVLFVIIIAPSCFANKILCIFSSPTVGFNTLSTGIVQGLISYGYNVTVISTFISNIDTPNCNNIAVFEEMKIYFDLMPKLNSPNLHTVYMGQGDTEAILMNKDVQRLLVNEDFDLVITEWLFSYLHAGFAAVLRAPWIIVTNYINNPYLLDDPRIIYTVPYLSQPPNVPMSLFDRINNVYTALTSYGDLPNQNEETYLELFKPYADARKVSLPPFSEAIRNIYAVFLNTHSSLLGYTQALPPNFVELAGVHILDPPEMDNDLLQILNKPSRGIVYVNIGPVYASSDIISTSSMKGLLTLFSGYNFTVILKTFNKNLKLPKNVFANHWWPQTAILSHPHTIIFVTSAGTMSVIEAVHYGVPMITVPFNEDQKINALRAVEQGYALNINIKNFLDEFDEKFIIMVNNILSFSRQANVAQNLFRQRPVPPAYLFVRFVELAIRTNGSHHLQSTALQYNFIQIWMLDVIFIIVTCISIFIIIFRNCSCKNIYQKMYLRFNPDTGLKKKRK